MSPVAAFFLGAVVMLALLIAIGAVVEHRARAQLATVIPFPKREKVVNPPPSPADREPGYSDKL